MLRTTYVNLRRLREERRNHIWGYVTRNLVRPVWLASAGEKADVIVGNPPWLAQRNMSRQMQKRFRAECQERGLWTGGKVATHQDLSAYFFARCVELYLREGCLIAFVLPYATMSRQPYGGFRSGNFGPHGSVRFIEAWTFDDRVKNLFNVPSCVLIASEGEPAALPAKVTTYAGELPRRDASVKEAGEHLRSRVTAWPKIREDVESHYGARFRQGATVVPRMLFVVERVASGRFGGDINRPLVESRRTNLEKQPWRELKALRGSIEKEFLWPLLLGESIAPFRQLGAVQAIIPWDTKLAGLLDAEAARSRGFTGLAEWLGEAEALWAANRSDPGLTLSGRLDYYTLASVQMTLAPRRVVYSASGAIAAAAIIVDQRTVIEHKLYWCAVETMEEARFMSAVLNSEATRAAVADQQSRGQWGARDFDKLLADAIPEFDADNVEHCELAEMAVEAEKVAAGVELPEKMNFVRVRQMIREALRENGVAGKMDKLVTRILTA